MASKSRPEVGVREAEMSLTAIVAHQKLIDEAKVRLEKAEVHVKSERRAYDKLVSQMGDVIRSYTQPHLFQQGVTVSDEDLEKAREAAEARDKATEKREAEAAAKAATAAAAAKGPGDTSWRATPFAELELSAKINEKLAANAPPIVTLGDAADWTAGGKAWTDVPGVSKAAAKQIEAALRERFAPAAAAK